MCNMQTVMHALCRHVPKTGLQTDKFSSCRNMQLLFTRSAQLVICCETCPKTKSKLYRQLLVATGRQAVNTAHMHRQGLTVPSRKCIRRNSFHCFFWFDQSGGKRSIRSLWNQIQQGTIVLLNPSLPWNCISRDILYVAGARIRSVI